MKEAAHAIAGGRTGTAVVSLVGVQPGAPARRVCHEHREPTQQVASRANLLSLERDGQVRGARGARIERINPLAHGPTTPRRFQCAHPRGRARTPSCRTFVWKKAEVCEAVKPSLKLKFFTLKFFGKSAVFRTLHARTVH